jgi:hypothetical protein
MHSLHPRLTFPHCHTPLSPRLYTFPLAYTHRHVVLVSTDGAVHGRPEDWRQRLHMESSGCEEDNHGTVHVRAPRQQRRTVRFFVFQRVPSAQGRYLSTRNSALSFHLRAPRVQGCPRLSSYSIELILRVRALHVPSVHVMPGQKARASSIPPSFLFVPCILAACVPLRDHSVARPLLSLFCCSTVHVTQCANSTC